MKSHPERVSNIIKPFINKYEWKGINYLSKIDDWKPFEKNNPSIALKIYMLKRKKYFWLIFQKLIQIVGYVQKYGGTFAKEIQIYGDC